MKYESIINVQSADGSWSMDLLNMILEYVPQYSFKEEIRSKINGAPKDNQKAMLTALVLAILMNKFIDDRDEWKLIEKKAKNYIKANPYSEADYKLFEDKLQEEPDEDDLMARLMAL